MTGAVRTVLGDITPGQLGRTDYHEHLFQVSPLLVGDELDDEPRSTAEAAALHAAGVDAMVDATPVGLGRRPGALARASAATGLRIVASTGAHRQEHYPDGHWLTAATEAQLTGRFCAELTGGMPATDSGGVEPPGGPPPGPHGQPVRAGLIKAGVGYWRISPFEQRVLAAAGAAAASTGAPVMVHLEYASGGFEVLAALAAAGLEAHRVVLAHVDRNPDPGLHADLAAAGAYLGYDGVARYREWPEQSILGCLLAVADRGGVERLLLGGDVARRSRFAAYGGMPGMAYLPGRFVPRLARAGGPELVRMVLVDNPARLLAWQAPEAPEVSPGPGQV